MPNYDPIVWIYDFLTKIVFGNKLERAKKKYLDYVLPNSRVLIVGGGTGSIIEYLDESEKNLSVDYVDISTNMVAVAKKRQNKSLKLSFYQQSILDFDGNDYDVIITNFFFDQFRQELGQEIANKLATKLRPNGILIFSDFITSKHFFDKFLLYIMLLFLRITASIRISQLPNYARLFSSVSLNQRVATMLGRTIKMAIYSVH